MSFSTINTLLAGISAVIVSCASTTIDTAEGAKRDRSVRDAEVQELLWPVSLAEVEKRFGPAESQPGPRVRYRASDHPGRFFWMYYFRPQTDEQPPKSKIMIHHIVIADAIEENGEVVWPEQWRGHSSEDASDDLERLYTNR